MAELKIHTTESEFVSDLASESSYVHASMSNSKGLDAVDVYRALAGRDAPSFIFDSVSPEADAGRFAFVCIDVDKIVCTNRDENPIPRLRELLSKRPNLRADSQLPGHVTGVFGYLAYEASQHFEPSVGELMEDPTGSPSAAYLAPRQLLVLDRETSTIHFLAFSDSIYEFDSKVEVIRDAATKLESVRRIAVVQIPEIDVEQVTPVFNGHFQQMVDRARKAIIEGELIQVVLGQRVEHKTRATAIDIYENLSRLNPSPYMYMVDIGDRQLIGASPELMLRAKNGTASIHPIAGTRPRGETAEEDIKYEADLISNEKESAEHVMLVDLARNDLGRVSKPGTVKVSSLKHIERYSHVMHLVSRVEGELADDLDGIDALTAGFPIGTLSGAPKIRSIQLISELEPEGRGPYCGAIGWFGANGDVDTGTIIRSVVLHDGVAHVQGGAGIVFDSTPETEHRESLQKTKAPLKAIALAELDRERYWRSSDESEIESNPLAAKASN